MRDPRGPIRTVTSTEVVHDCTRFNLGQPGSCRHTTYAECDHVGHGTAHMTVKLGERARCYECGLVDGRCEDCGHTWTRPGDLTICPECHSAKVAEVQS